MNNVITKIVALVLCVVMFFGFVLQSQSLTQNFIERLIHEDPYRGSFRLEGTVVPGKPVAITFVADPITNLPQTSIDLLIPDGIQVIGGNTSWQGDLLKNKALELGITLLAPNNGEWEIRAVVKNPTGPRFDRVYFSYLVTETSRGSLESFPTQKEKIVGQPNNRLSESGPSLIQPQSLAGSTKVVGRQQYERDDGSQWPVRAAKIELWEDISSGPDSLLATSSTDANGYFTFDITLSEPTNVYVKVGCDTTPTKCTDSGGAAYYVTIPDPVSATVYPDQSNDLGSWYITHSYSDPWEAMDYVQDEYHWVSDHGNGWTRSQVTIEWPSTECQNDTGAPWPCSDGNNLYMPDQVVTWWDRPTVLHEYAHAVMYGAYGFFPGGCNPGDHYIDTESCEGFAITEGFAEFMVSAVDNNPSNTWGGDCGLADIEDNTWEWGRDCTANNTGAIVEGAVASILWDIFDSGGGDPDRDNMSWDFDEIWHVMRSNKPRGINAFWDAWFTIYGSKPNMNLIFYDHGVDRDTSPNSASNPSPPNGATNQPLHLTLNWSGSDPDEDVLKYVVYFGTTNPPTSVICSDIGSTSCNPGNLNSATRYYWYVVSKDSIGKSRNSQTWYFTVGNTGIQSPPIYDFDGDGDTDVAIYRPSQGGWYVKDQFFTKYGASGDIPVPGDYDGDGDTDVAVYRRSQGGWYVKNQFFTRYGLPGDIPVPADYDGDGDTDVAVYRPSQGGWYVKDQFFTRYGLPGDIPVPADYDGDGDTDVAVYRPSQGGWYVKDQFFTRYGLPGDIPVPADYDGDGDIDVAVYRPSQSGWYVKNQFFTRYGLPGDIPIPGDYDDDGDTDVAIYRPSQGGWYVKDQFFNRYGLPGDIPIPVRDTNGDGDPYQ